MPHKKSSLLFFPTPTHNYEEEYIYITKKEAAEKEFLNFLQNNNVCHNIPFSMNHSHLVKVYASYIFPHGVRHPLLLLQVGRRTLDGVLEVDFLFHPNRHSLGYQNHNNLFNFALLCLWNVQIQFQFWCWLF